MTLIDRTPLEKLNGYPEFPPGLTLLRRVKLYCTWCIGDAPPVECFVKCCPLWAYRTGRGPKRQRSAAQTAQAAGMSEKLRASRQKRTKNATRAPRRGVGRGQAQKGEKK